MFFQAGVGMKRGREEETTGKDDGKVRLRFAVTRLATHFV